MAVIIVAVVAVTLIGLAAWLRAPDESRASLEARYLDPADSYHRVDGATLRVRVGGPIAAPAILLLHGFGSSLETWEPWARALSARYRVIRLDLPGFGLSGPDPTGDYSDTRAVALIEGLMDQLGVRRASLIGNSLGGRLAWTFAAAHPDRVAKLVLVSPDGFASPGFEYGKAPKVPPMMKLLPYVLPRGMLKANLAMAYGDSRRLSDATLSRYRDMMLAPGVRKAILDRTGQVLLKDPAPILAGIHVPTLLLWGEKDGMIPIGNADDYLRDLPDVRLVRLPGLGHVPFEEAPEESLPPVEAFLADPSG